jgi:23S rRNA C2498 (ribose-2'-O)-methylase RlmM
VIPVLAKTAEATPRVIAYCRAGFEAEAAADLRCVATAAETDVDVDSPVGRGFVVATPHTFDSQRWPRALLTTPPVFVRALFFGAGRHQLLTPNERRPAAWRLWSDPDALRAEFPLPGAPLLRSALFGTLHLKRPIPAMARSFRVASDRETADGGRRWRIRHRHCRRTPGAYCYGRRERFVGASLAPWGSRWTMGIPRRECPLARRRARR